jgi:hypothetical protein
MRSGAKQLIEAYRRIVVFLGEHPAPPPASYTEQKRVLDDVLAQLDDHSIAQEFGGKQTAKDVERQDVLMKRLRSRHLRPIAAIARSEAQAVPGITRELRMPRIGIGPLRLVVAAKAMRQAAEPYKDVFVRNGRPVDFLAQLDAAIGELAQTQLGRAVNVGTKVGARAGIEQQLRRGRKAVEILDTVVKSAFEEDAVVLARWRTARRVPAIPGGGGALTLLPDVAPISADETKKPAA